VIAFCTIYTEQGKVTELEAAVAALNEMVGVLVVMQSSRDPQVRAFVESLRNTVFHNMRELELVPNLIA
jgi:hypothetical protein